MADQELPLDVAADEKKGGSKLIIIIAAVVVLLIGGGAAFFLLGSGEDEVVDEVVDEAHLPPVYMPMRPAFVVNFANGSGQTRFLQVEITLVGRDPVAMAALEDHIPLVKSKLVNIFSSQVFDELRSPEGKENMREQAIQDLQTLLTDELGDPTIERILFTNFVLQ